MISTFGLVLRDWKKWLKSSSRSGTLHCIRWRRVIVDEGTFFVFCGPQRFDYSIAHNLRNQSCSTFKAVHALEAERRWAVTGTPIQNRLADLLSLFIFLRYHPFDQSEVFQRHVTERWKAHSDPDAIASLKVLVNSITLRRPKRAIHLPQKIEEVRYLSFTNEEREHYERTKLDTLRKFDSIEQVSSTSSFVNALKWINGLRLICNHGLNYNPNSEANMSPSQLESLTTWNRQAAEECFEQLCDAGLALCSECGADLSPASNDLLDCRGDRHSHPVLAQSLKLLCAPCFLRSGHVHSYEPICNHAERYRCSSNAGSGQIFASQVTSTKVDALVYDLLSLPNGQKRLCWSSCKGFNFLLTLSQPCLLILDENFRSHSIDVKYLQYKLPASGWIDVGTKAGGSCACFQQRPIHPCLSHVNHVWRSRVGRHLLLSILPTDNSQIDLDVCFQSIYHGTTVESCH